MSQFNSIGILTPPSRRGLGMIKSPPLDIAHLIAWLRKTTDCNIHLIDYRIHAINQNHFWKAKGVGLDIYSNFRKCFDHLLSQKDLKVVSVSRQILREINFKDLDYLFISVSVLEQLSLEYLVSSLCIAKELKLLRPDIKIVFFGSCPKKHIKKVMNTFDFVDAFLEDGSELSINKYIKYSDKKKPISGLSYRVNDTIIFSPLQKDKIEFNDYPLPDFSLFDLESYKCNGRLALPYEINRGCSQNCFFCYFTHKNSLSYKDISRVIKDLRSLSQQYKTNAFHFVDGAMNSDEKNLGEICDAITRDLPAIKWSAMARPNMEYSLIKKMRDAGCVHIRWGVESGSERMLRKIKKGTTPETVKRTLKDAHNLGVYNYITLLTGTAVEIEEDIHDTKEFIDEVQQYVDSAQECFFGELGSFDISRLDALLSGVDRPLPPRKLRYDEVLQKHGLAREDIIQVLTKRLMFTFLMVPDNSPKSDGDVWNRASVTFPTPPLEIVSLSSFFSKNSLYDDFEYLDTALIIDSNEKIKNYLTSLYKHGQEKYYDKLSNLILKFSAHSDYFMFFVPWWTQGIEVSIRVAKKFKETYPHSKIIFYGPYCQLYSKKILLENKFIDFVLTGEIEEFLAPFDGKTNPEEFPSMAYVKDGAYCRNPKKPFDFASHGNYLDYSCYLKFIKKFNLSKAPFLFYELSRGCKYSCYFCSQLKGAKLKYLKVEDVFQDIQKIVNQTGIKNIYFLDSLLNFDYSFLDELMDRIIHSDLDLRWSSYMVAEDLDVKLLKKIKKAGCVSIRYGIESANPNKQKYFSKNVNLQIASRILMQASREGIVNQISFITGLPYEQKNDTHFIVKFMNDNRDYLDIVNIYKFKVRKDTPIYKKPNNFDIKLITDSVEEYRDGVPYEEIKGLGWESKTKEQESSYQFLKKVAKKMNFTDFDPQIYFYYLTSGKMRVPERQLEELTMT